MKTKVIEIHELGVDELTEIIAEKLLLKLKHYKDDLDKKEVVFLTRTETCKMLKISLPTLWHWSKNGILISYRLGNRLFYKKQEIIDCMQRTSRVD